MNIDPKEYYATHPEQLKFIYDFMKIKKPGVFRARVIEFLRDNDTGEVHVNRTAPLYYDRRNWVKHHSCALCEFGSVNDVARATSVAKTVYWLHYIWSEDAKRCDSRMDLRSGEHIVGWTPVFDVDSLGKVEGRGRRVVKDDAETLKVFEFVRCAIKDELKSWGLWDGTRAMFSGNGYYLILPDYYGELDDIMDYGDAMICLQKDINVLTNREYGVEQIDWKRGISRKYGTFAWNRYTKVPYSFHEKLDDMSYPLDKEQNIVESLECSEVDWRR